MPNQDIPFAFFRFIGELVSYSPGETFAVLGTNPLARQLSRKELLLLAQHIKEVALEMMEHRHEHLGR